jgi:putative transposase
MALNPRRRSYPSDLTDAEWSQIEPHIPKNKTLPKNVQHSKREILDAILYVDRTGLQWEFLPHDFPPWKTVYGYFIQWRDDGTFERVADTLRRKLRALEGREEEPTLGILDSQSRQSTEVGGPKGFDAGKKVKGRKRHILVDILGCVLAVFVTAANVQDRDMLRSVVHEVRYTVPSLQKILVDGGYRGPQLTLVQAEFGIPIEVVLRSDTAKGFEVIPKRWVVERTFGWLNRERRLSKEYDRNPESTRAWIHVASFRMMARRLAAA